ncbi:MAG: thioredoxin domain-containing protein [Phormidesmis priestleyi]|uniref:Thioredoxin domain-containing protein n=1 Tax=Phormidesmis priestleyi TaxID=268141 RepID=A0A2W4XUH7_9CYAN|nr:MAG: thioredoxin domain-containing protein [Phormidesmis priestleyi]
MTNRLARSSSLYLRKHAENPVDWWPWCDQALATAKADNKPIFLSIGYSSCHWCTVMEGEAFSDEAIAHYLNTYFLPIKVDREERPDIDSIYMQALQMMVGQGGWPLNIFLTPNDRVPFYGGTYFPVEARYGRPGFLEVLQALRDRYDTEPDQVALVKSQILGSLNQSAQLAAGELDPAFLPAGIAACARTLMPFDAGNRFPMIPYARLVLQGDRLLSNLNADSSTAAPVDALHLSRQRAFNLVTGGIFDQVAGGFHRYTVDPTWTVPHFEKMLYDNGLIVEFLAEVWQSRDGKATSAEYRAEATSEVASGAAIVRAVDKTVTWLKREMLAPEGFFYAAQDADNFTSAEAVEPEEGDFYVWSMSELKAALTEIELSEVSAAFTISDAGNFEGRNVLQRKADDQLSEIVEAALDKLFQIRYGAPLADTPLFEPAADAQAAKSRDWPGRIPPVTDTKMIVAWNALMISGLAKAAVAFERADYLALALKVTRYIQHQQQVEGVFYRLNYGGQAVVLAQSEDYALMIKALIDVQQACLGFEAYVAEADDWLSAALALQVQFDQTLGSDQGGYFNASNDLIVQERAYQDSAVPAANGVAVTSLVRLFLLTENFDYLNQAEAALKSFSTVLQKAPRACPSLLSALDWFTHPVLVRTSAEQIALMRDWSLPTGVLKLEKNLSEMAIALVCRGLSCLKPATDLAMMRQQIEQSQQIRP